MIAHGLFFVGDKCRYMSLDAAMELKLTTNLEIFDLNESLDMDYNYLDTETEQDLD